MNCIYSICSVLMFARVVVCICIASDVRGCTNSRCIQFQIPSILCPILKTYFRVSPACFTAADIRKVRWRNNSICVQFRIPFSYSRPFYLSQFIYLNNNLIMLPRYIVCCVRKSNKKLGLREERMQLRIRWDYVAKLFSVHVLTRVQGNISTGFTINFWYAYGQWFLGKLR